MDQTITSLRRRYSAANLSDVMHLAFVVEMTPEEFALSMLQDTVDGWNAAAGLSIRTLPRLLCAAILRAQSEARV